MLLFGNKLSKSKESSDGVSVDIRRETLRGLSNQEKILLLELQKTRENIVEELSQLQQFSAPAQWANTQKVIQDYSKSLPVNGQGSNQAIRSGVDSLTVLSTTGQSALDSGLGRSKLVKLPVFRMPPVSSTLKSDKNRKNRSDPGGGTNFKDISFKFNSYEDFERQCGEISRNINPKEKKSICTFLGFSDQILVAIESELSKRFETDQPILVSSFSLFSRQIDPKENLSPSDTLLSSFSHSYLLPISSTQRIDPHSTSSPLSMSQSFASFASSQSFKSTSTTSFSRRNNSTTHVKRRKSASQPVGGKDSDLRGELLKSLKNMQEYTTLVSAKDLSLSSPLIFFLR